MHVTLRLFWWRHPTAAAVQFVLGQLRIANSFGNRNKALVDPSIDLSQLIPAKISILQSSHLSAYIHRVALAILHVWLTGD